MSEQPIARGMRPTLHPLDEDSASRLLQGLVHPDDAPPGYASVADLLSRAAQPSPLREDAGAATIAAMVEAIRSSAPAPVATPSRNKRSLLGKVFAGKALVAMGLVLTAGGAAAATGSLPGPVQGAVAEAVSHVGVDLPGNGGKSAAHRQDGEHRPADKGKAGDKGQSGDQPAEDGTTTTTNKGSVISGLTHDPALDGQPKGPVVCDVASQGRCQAGDEHGKPADGSTTTTTEGSGDGTTTTTADHGNKPAPGEGNTPPVTTGSKATGQENSGRDLTPPSTGNGKPAG